MQSRIILLSTLLLVSVFGFVNQVEAQPDVEAPSWEIGWVDDQSDAVLLEAIGDRNSNDWWDRGGIITLKFYIENNRPTEVSVDLDFEADHDDDFTWVEVDLDENVKVAAGANKTFTITLEAGSLNDVAEGSTHGLTVIGDEESLLPTTSQSIEADTKVPRVAVMIADVIDEDVPLMAGTSADIKVRITNLGNKNDALVNSETKLTVDGCPQLSVDSDTSLYQSVEPDSTSEGLFKVEASSSHPSKNCVVSLKSTSAGLASVVDSIEIEVRSTSSEVSDDSGNGGSDNGSNNYQDESTDEGLRGNFLPSLSLFSIITLLTGAALFRQVSSRGN